MAASTVAERPGHARRRKRAERVFFSAYLISLALLMFAGFAPSFFLRGLVEPYWPLRPLPPLVVVHAIVATAVVLLFPLQALLIAGGHQTLHQRTGNWGFVLGGVMVALAYCAAAGLYRDGIVSTLPTTDLVVVIAVLTLAWRWRWNAQAHKRIMVALACLLVLNGVERLPFWDRTTLSASLAANLVAYPLILPLWLWDLATATRLHRSTIAGSAFLTAAVVPRLLNPSNPEWSKFLAVLPGFGWP